MNIAIFAFSNQGCKTALKTKEILCGEDDECHLYTIEKFKSDGFMVTSSPLSEFVGPVFLWADAMVFIGGTGIAIRSIAPHIKNKKVDPAVLVVDELGKFVIAMLSGHIGGANELANELAYGLGATPVVTTATDVNGKFSVDAWAAKKGLSICSMTAAKAVSAEILERPVALESDFTIVGDLPNGVITGERTPIGICVSCYDKKPFETTLLLVPKLLNVGIGCRRGTAKGIIAGSVEKVFKDNCLRKEGICSVSSIDLKKDEIGLHEFVNEIQCPVNFYSADELRLLDGEFTPSDFVCKITGVDNVCERAALIGADKLIVKKTSSNGVTVAVAVKDWEVHFG